MKRWLHSDCAAQYAMSHPFHEKSELYLFASQGFERWPSLSAQQSPIIKWNLGGLKCDVALSTGCARRVVELA